MSSSITRDLGLVDHHCHGLVDRELSLAEFSLLGSESEWPAPPGLAALDSPFGLALRRLCSPILDLEVNTDIASYLARRSELGPREVHRRMLAASGIDRFLIETGFPTAAIASPAEMAELSGKAADTVIRLEAIAETVARSSSAQSFVDDVEAEIRRQYATAVGVKTIAAYRFGLDIAPERPARTDVTAAVDSWLTGAAASGSYRLTDPVIISYLVWIAVDLKTVIQMHVGFGDADVQLDRADPSHLTPFLRATRESGARIALLHCYPFVREAAVLAHLFPHVWFDVSCLSHYAGPSAPTLIRQAMEVGPFGKVLFASDAYGLAEHYLVSSTVWRHGLGRLLDEWVADDWVTTADAERFAHMIASDNARALYGLGD
ncbi:MAG: amidohydrolase family protein [Cryobacterium sp.]|nr:amidohydrolase family protein [Cryobacterium sp.]